MSTPTPTLRLLRETHEDDTCVEVRLDEAVQRAKTLRDHIVADGRLDAADLPALLEILGLLPAIAADCAKSLRYNREINGLYGDYSRARQRARMRGRSAGEDCELEAAA